jgi:hypothetical protein
MTNKEGPFYAAFRGDTKGVIKQELVTYKVKDGILIKETVQRDYNNSGEDYIDSSTSTPLGEIKHEHTA